MKEKAIMFSFDTDEARTKFLDDLKALVEYCTDRDEENDFIENVSDGGPIDDEEWDILLNSENHVYARGMRVLEVLEKVEE